MVPHGLNKTHHPLRHQTYNEGVSLTRRHRYLTLTGLAAATGTAVGLLCVAFHWSIEAFTWLLTGYWEYTHHIGQNGWLRAVSTGHLPLGAWFILFTPIIAGFTVGALLQLVPEVTRGHGIPDIMLAVRRRSGIIPTRVAFVKLLASAITLGGGGSVGRIGPIVEAGATVGSWSARQLKLPTASVILLTACGAAAGVAATFDAPLGGAVFALELILLTVNAEAISLIVIATVAAVLVGRSLMGGYAVFQVPRHLELAAATDLGWVALIGIVAALAGITLSKTIYRVQDFLRNLYHGPEWAKPGLLGILIGMTLFFLPELYGSGYPIQTEVLLGNYAVGFVIVLLIGRIALTAITLGIGQTGGVFGPTLFVGACAGAAVGTAVQPFAASSVATFGVIAMGAALAAAARTPIAAVLIIVEMTHQYDLTLPLMLAVGIATVLSRFLTNTSIYTEKLRRAGDALDDPVEETLMARREARVVMTQPPIVLNGNLTLSEATEMARDEPLVAVVGDNGEFRGCITPLMMARAQAKGQAGTVGQMKLDATRVTPDAKPSQVLDILVTTRRQAVPVVESEKLLGWISQADLVRLIHRQHRRALDKLADQQAPAWDQRMKGRVQRWEANHPRVKRLHQLMDIDFKR